MDITPCNSVVVCAGCDTGVRDNDDNARAVAQLVHTAHGCLQRHGEGYGVRALPDLGEERAPPPPGRLQKRKDAVIAVQEAIRTRELARAGRLDRHQRRKEHEGLQHDMSLRTLLAESALHVVFGVNMGGEVSL